MGILTLAVVAFLAVGVIDPSAGQQNGLNLNVIVIKDSDFRTRFGDKQDERVKAVFKHVQVIFGHSSLGISIIPTLLGSYDIGQSWPATAENLGILSDIVAGAGLKDANAYVFLTSQKDDRNGDLNAAWPGSTCSKEIKKRSVIVEYVTSDTITAAIVANAFGKSLGINPDFVALGLIRVGRKAKADGSSCNGIGGYMDSPLNANRWSPCSSEDMFKYITENQPFCLPLKKSTGPQSAHSNSTNQGGGFPAGGFKMDIIVIYDSAFASRFINKAAEKVISLFKLVGNIFQQKSFETKIITKLIGTAEVGGTWLATEDNIKTLTEALPGLVEADAYVFLSTEDDRNTGNHNIACRGCTCDAEQKHRISIVEYTNTDTLTAVLIANAIAINLGIKNDVLTENGQRKPRRSSDGTLCTDVAGYMDAPNQAARWTRCSVEDFVRYYATNQPFCLKPASKPKHPRPAGPFVLNVWVIYDRAFSYRFDCPEDIMDEVFALVKEHMRTLESPILVNVVGKSEVDQTWTASKQNLKPLAEYVKTADLPEANAYALLSSDGDRQNGLPAHANVGTTCNSDKQSRVGISEYLKNNLYTAKVVASALASSLGIKADYTVSNGKPSNRYAGDGATLCTGAQGYMDFWKWNPIRWTKCSNEDFNSYLDSNLPFCLDKGSATSTPSPTTTSTSTTTARPKEGFVMNILVIYDSGFSNRFDCPDQTIDEIFKKVKELMDIPARPVLPVVVGKMEVDRKWTASLQNLGSAADFVEKHDLQDVNGYVFMSDDGDNTGDNVNFGYLEGACHTSKRSRSSITEYIVNNDYTAKLLANTLGITLGMSPDSFRQNGNRVNRYSENGTLCSSVGGYMDLGRWDPRQWTQCSVDDFSSFVRRNQPLCMKWTGRTPIITPIMSTKEIPAEGFRMNIWVVYDNAFKSRLGGRAEQTIDDVFSIVADKFKHPTFGTKFDVVVVGKKHLNVNLKATDDNASLLASYVFNWNLRGADAYVMMSSDQDSAGKVSVTTSLNICKAPNQARSAIVEYLSSNALTAKIVTHTLGLLMGLKADYLALNGNRVPRTSKSGAACTGVGGFMGAIKRGSKWSQCSVDDFKDFFQQNNPFCLQTNPKPTTTPTTTTTSDSCKNKWGDCHKIGRTLCWLNAIKRNCRKRCDAC